MADISGVVAASAAQQANASAAAKGAEQPVLRNSNVQDAPVKVPAIEKTEVRTTAEDKRFAQVVQAAESFFKDFYAISDTRFTIFKDGSGQYITRFTNLRDGSITYYPEQEISRYAQSRGLKAGSAYKEYA